jgi:hypothetical protein
MKGECKKLFKFVTFLLQHSPLLAIKFGAVTVGAGKLMNCVTQHLKSSQGCQGKKEIV